jgi:Domain of unknown function (DUF1929)/Galactose oxidase, central domain
MIRVYRVSCHRRVRAASRCFRIWLSGLFAIGCFASISSAATGKWIAPQDWGHGDSAKFAVHLMLLPGDSTYHSRILFYNGEFGTDFFAGGVWGWRPITDSCSTYPNSNFDSLSVAAPGENPFCSGAAALGDGRLFVIGGTDTSIGAYGDQQARAFTPGTGTSGGTWGTPSSMSLRRWYPTATTLRDGRILVTAGNSYPQQRIFGGKRSGSLPASEDSVYRFAPIDYGAWDSPVLPVPFVGTKPSAREGHTAVDGAGIEGIGEHVIFGGRTASGPVNETWLLIRDDNTLGTDYGYSWSQPWFGSGVVVPNHLRRTEHTAIPALGKMMVVFGGAGGTGPSDSLFNDVWRLETNAGVYSWAPMNIVGTPPSPRRGHAAVYEEDSSYVGGASIHQRMLVFGGADSSGSAVTDTSVWELRFNSSVPDSATWVRKPMIGQHPGPRFWHAMAAEQIKRGDTVTGKTGMVAYLYGGTKSSSSAAYGDTLWELWCYQNDDSVRWQPLVVASAGGITPGARARLSMNFDESQGRGKARLYLFGGESAGAATDNYTYVVDAWDPILTPTWERWAGTSFSPSGHTACKDLNDTQARLPEIYNPVGNSWSTVSTAPYLEWSYPLTFAIPGGSPDSGGRVISVGDASDSYTLDLPSSLQSPVNGWVKRANSGFRPHSAVMYLPGKILIAGGDSLDVNGSSIIVGTSKTLDTSNPNNSWIATGTGSALVPRYYHNLVLLPTGKVLAVGGVQSTNVDDFGSSVLWPQMWDPATGAWTNVSDSGTRLPPEARVRNYHSTAMLLPDGRVLSTSGNNQPDELNAEIFCPPYLFESDNSTPAPRPVISNAPSSMTWRKIFTVTVSDTVGIRSAALVRPAAVTHGFDENQRFVPLSFVVASNPSRLLVTAPANADTAPPGYYMLFLTGSHDGATALPEVPSIAKWLRIGIAGRDTIDSVWPGTVSDLRACYDGTPTNAGYVDWTAPADDTTLAASGPAASYDLRKSTSPINTLTDFNAATSVSTGAPHLVGTQEEAIPGGLVSGTYYFRLRVVDDNHNYSFMSNLTSMFVSTHAICGDGFLEGTGGWTGSHATHAPGSTAVRSATESGLSENSMFNGARFGAATTDIVRLVSPPATNNGSYQIRLRTGASGHYSVDAVKLMTVDHTAAVSAYALDGVGVVGTPAATAQVTASDGTDLTSVLAAGASYSLGPAQTVTATLSDSAATRSALIIEASSGTSWSDPDSGGVLVQVPDGSAGWQTVGHIFPRKNMSETAVSGVTGNIVRLRCLSGCTLRSVRSLASAQESPTIGWATLADAQTSAGNSQTAALAASDSSSSIFAGSDTVATSFTAPAVAAGLVRDYFLTVTATQVTESQASQMRSHLATIETPTLFALRQNQPNPFTSTTLIRFDLPRGVAVRLEVFDAQGRRMATLANRFFAAGYQSIQWDHHRDNGQRVGPGVYFYRIEAGPFRDRKKMVLLAN